LPKSVYRRHVGRHEDESLRLWRAFAKRVTPPRAILDIGAFHGEFAIAAREVNPEAPIFAFEPNPDSLSYLNTACAGKGISIVPNAVSDQDGTVSFLCSTAQSRILKNDAPTTTEQTVQVQCLSLSAWVSDQRVSPALIKIDIEGAEPAVLKAARGMVEDCQPVILCEVLTNEAGDLLRKALPAGYSYWQIEENGGVQENDRIARYKWRNKNWLFVPNNRRLEIP